MSSEQQIFKDYEFEDTANITTFVAAHSQVEKILIDGRKAIKKIFGDVKVTLEMDYWDEDPKLVATIYVAISVEELMDKMQEFDHTFSHPRRRYKNYYHWLMFTSSFI